MDTFAALKPSMDETWEAIFNGHVAAALRKQAEQIELLCAYGMILQEYWAIERLHTVWYANGNFSGVASSLQPL